MIVGGRCVGDAREGSIGRGRGSGCFMRPLTFTSPAFQSAVSIKDGCSSYVFPIHQRPRDARPRTDGQLDMMEGERVCITQGSEGKVKILRNENEKKTDHQRGMQLKSQSRPENGEGKMSGTNKMVLQVCLVQRAEAAFCLVECALFKVGCLPLSQAQSTVSRYRIFL